MSTEHRYYIAAGRSLAVVNQVIAQLKKCREARNAFCKRFGAEKFYFNGSRFIGIVIDDPAKVPGGFKLGHIDRNTYVPDRRTKLGKSIANEMAGLRSPDSMTLSNALGFNGYIGGGCLHTIGTEELGDKHILSVPAPADFTPPDAIPIKTSEYWALREAVKPTPAEAAA